MDSTASLNPKIFLLMLGTLAVSTEAYVFAGLFNEMSIDLFVSIPKIGLLASVFALLYALAAPLGASLVSKYNKKKVLVLALLGMGCLNLLTAFSPNYGVLMTLRISCAFIACLIIPTASSTAAFISEGKVKGKALGVVLGGIPLAFIAGIPLGSIVGDSFGWRATFLYSGTLATVISGILFLFFPSVPSKETGGLTSIRSVLQGPALGYLLLTCISFAATFVVIAYIGPVSENVLALSGIRISFIQVFIGVGSILGIVSGAMLVNKEATKELIITVFVLAALSLTGYSAISWDVFGDSTMVRIILLPSITMIGATSVFALVPVTQYKLTSLFPDNASVALSVNGSMIFLGQGLGAGIGSLIINQLNLSYLGIGGALMALLGLVIRYYTLNTVEKSKNSRLKTESLSISKDH